MSGVISASGTTRAQVSAETRAAPLRRSTRAAARKVAPLRADYAAMVLAAGRWYRNVRHGAPVLAALWAGQGAVLVEAAGEALDRAPGLLRLDHRVAPAA